MAQRLWTPADLAVAPAAWLDPTAASTLTVDASTGKVSEWRSRAGTFKVAQSDTSKQPVLVPNSINGLPAVQWSGSAQLTGSDAVFPTGTSPDHFAGIAQDVRTGSDFVAMWARGPGDGNYNTRMLATKNASRDTAVSFYNLDVNGPTLGNLVRLVSVRIMATASTVSILTGLDGGYSSTTTNSTINTTRGTFWLGRWLYNNSFNGLMAELVWLGYAPTDDERLRLDGYLAWRWGKQASLPVGHAYAAAAPMVDDGAGTASSFAPLAVAASAALLIAGTAGVALGAMSAAGASTAIIRAAAGATLAPVTSQPSGKLPSNAAAVALLDGIGVTAAASAPIRGATTATLDEIATGSAGDLDIHATASAPLGSITIDARASGVQSTSGAAVATLGSIAAAGVAALRLSAVADAPLAPVQAAGAGIAQIAAMVAGKLGGVTAEAAATTPLRAVAAFALGPVSVTSKVYLPIEAAASLALQPIGIIASALNSGAQVPLPPPEQIVRMPRLQRRVTIPAKARLVTIVRDKKMLLIWPNMRVGAAMILGAEWADSLLAGDAITDRSVECQNGLCSIEQEEIEGTLHTVKVRAVAPGQATIVLTAKTRLGEDLKDAVRITVSG